MTTIKDFEHTLRTAELPLPNGHAVTARELVYADDRAIEDAHPKPLAPMVRNANAGSNAPKVADAGDPGFVLAHAEWFDRLEIMRLAVAIDYRPEGRGPWDRLAGREDRAAWLHAAVDELGGRLSMADIDRMRNGMANIGRDALEDTGLGNSGAGSSPADG